MQLATWLDNAGEHRAAFAKRVGVHPITVSKWCSGLWLPRAELLQRINDATNGAVTANDFLDAVLRRRQAVIEAEAA